MPTLDQGGFIPKCTKPGEHELEIIAQKNKYDVTGREEVALDVMKNLQKTMFWSMLNLSDKRKEKRNLKKHSFLGTRIWYCVGFRTS